MIDSSFLAAEKARTSSRHKEIMLEGARWAHSIFYRIMYIFINVYDILLLAEK